MKRLISCLSFALCLVTGLPAAADIGASTFRRLPLLNSQSREIPEETLQKFRGHVQHGIARFIKAVETESPLGHFEIYYIANAISDAISQKFVAVAMVAKAEDPTFAAFLRQAFELVRPNFNAGRGEATENPELMMTIARAIVNYDRLSGVPFEIHMAEAVVQFVVDVFAQQTREAEMQSPRCQDLLIIAQAASLGLSGAQQALDNEAAALVARRRALRAQQ